MILKIDNKIMKYTVTCKEYPDIEGIGSSKDEAVADFHNKVEVFEKAIDKDHRIAVLEMALKLACEPRDDWSGREYDAPYTNYYDYFIDQAEKELKEK